MRTAQLTNPNRTLIYQPIHAKILSRTSYCIVAYRSEWPSLRKQSR